MFPSQFTNNTSEGRWEKLAVEIIGNDLQNIIKIKGYDTTSGYHTTR